LNRAQPLFGEGFCNRGVCGQAEKRRKSKGKGKPHRTFDPLTKGELVVLLCEKGVPSKKKGEKGGNWNQGEASCVKGKWPLLGGENIGTGEGGKKGNRGQGGGE